MKSIDQYGVERTILVIPAYDMRHRDCGVHGMELLFVLRGPRGAVCFQVFTNMQLPHVAEQIADDIERQARGKARTFTGMSAAERITLFFQPIGADVGYHSPVPQSEYQEERGTPDQEHCQFLGAPCYYDGSSLRAKDWTPEFIAKGEDWVFNMLEIEYRRRYSEPVPDWHSALMEEADRFLYKQEHRLERESFALCWDITKRTTNATAELWYRLALVKFGTLWIYGARWEDWHQMMMNAQAVLALNQIKEAHRA